MEQQTIFLALDALVRQLLSAAFVGIFGFGFMGIPALLVGAVFGFLAERLTRGGESWPEISQCGGANSSTSANIPPVWIVGTLSILILVVVVLKLFVVGIANETIQYEMTWSHGKDNLAHYREIRLQFQKHPAYFQTCRSDELASYLESLNSDIVQATFVRITDFGQTRGYFLKKIGNISTVTPFEHSWGSLGARCDGGGFEKREGGNYMNRFDYYSLFLKDLQP